MDSRFTISKADSIQWLIDQCQNVDIALFVHPSRCSIKDEYNYVRELISTDNQYLLDRYQGEDMQYQYEVYQRDASFVDNRLFACGLFVYSKRLVANRDNNLMKDWFYHNCLYSVQDQLSLPYLLQKHNTIYNTLEGNIFSCPYFKYA